MNKTVYIIGAGASQEAGLPTGDRLKKTISGMLNICFTRGALITGDPLLTQALQERAREFDRPKAEKVMRSYINAAQQISKGMPLAASIDNYIDAHPGNDEVALCGKLAIVRSILSAEGISRLAVNTSDPHPSMAPDSLDETWYVPFFKLLTENCSYGDMLRERLGSIVFIVFNYDRCIEHFMYHALQIYYENEITGKEAAELVKNMNIYHPYGSVGSLPWYTDGDSMEFGTEPKIPKLLQLTKKIKTYTEGTDPDSSEISEIRNHIDSAHKLVFLGFAFHELNMQLLKAKETPGSPARQLKYYATTHGFSESDKKAIHIQINRLHAGTFVEREMSKHKCAAFFQEFSKSLAF